MDAFSDWAPRRPTAKRYVDCLGGLDRRLAKAKEYIAADDLRFAGQLLQHAVFAQPERGDAKELLAGVDEQLGYRVENGTWRNFHLTRAQELRHGIGRTDIDMGTGMANALSIEQVFDTLAIRIDAPSAWHETTTVDWHVTDVDQTYRTTLHNGALIQQQSPPRRQVRPDRDADQTTAAGPAGRTRARQHRARRGPRCVQADAQLRGDSRPGVRHRHAVTGVRCRTKKRTELSTSKRGTAA
jgi:alkyl sulfatase BDS1-like metallo-beta-lactamase superfamily hydrolase